MKSLPLHSCTVDISSAIINRCYIVLHATSLLALTYYRSSSLLNSKPKLPCILVFLSELLLSFLWLLDQAYLWRPVSRTTFPERLPEDKELPAIDVLICTADHRKEPPVEVMNTVLSAMSLDYPLDKLSVYLSDDGGSALTLNCMRETWLFARSWLPFCTRFNIKTRCPKAYFSTLEDDHDGSWSLDYQEEKKEIKHKYGLFKERLKRAEENVKRNQAMSISGSDRPPRIEVMCDEYDKGADIRFKQEEMPLLVYVSREKRPDHPHNFKAGALNVLLRVSGIITNAPYVLVLDCDMYCNDPTSARQAMCFYLDTSSSSSMAFVQFPQKFHNVPENDIYDGQLRKLFVIRWPGVDGLQGPILSGTGFYMKREALYDNPSQQDTVQLRQSFGRSDEFILSVQRSSGHNLTDDGTLSSKLQQEAQFLATCTYENDTSWGEQVGFLYHSVVEDYFTGFILHSKGRTSVFCNPSKPGFLGSATSNLNDMLVQGTRWNSGLFEVALSRFCPFIYGLQRMSLLQTICYSYLALQPLYFLPVWGLATLPQLCLLNGIPVYPQVSSSWFNIFSFIFLASMLKHLQEVLASGGSAQTWVNEQRIWMIKSVTAYTYGSLDAILKCVGIRGASFLLTNKVTDDEQVKLHQQGKFNFQGSTLILTPVVTLLTLNMISLIGGAALMLARRSWTEMLGQVLLSLYILLVNYPVIEGMFFRKDKGRVPPPITLLAIVFAVLLLCLGAIAI